MPFLYSRCISLSIPIPLGLPPLMITAAMVAVDDGFVLLIGLSGPDVLIDGGIGDPHVILIGLALIVSALSQKVGIAMNDGFKAVGLAMFDKGTCTTVFVTVLGLICAMTPLGKLPAIEELSSVLLYAVVAMLASQAPLNALIDAPMWVLYGFLILIVHVVLMFVLSKIFHWDLCMVSTASVANIGGSASAPIIACAYNDSFAGIGVLMGVLGAAVGNFMGMGMGWILQVLA